MSQTILTAPAAVASSPRLNLAIAPCNISTQRSEISLDRPSLNPDNREIRLLEIQPGDFAKPISSRFVVTSLNNPISYQCLSYAWGDPEVTSPIVVSSQSYPVTTNLLSALYRVRSLSERRLVWIDALCINQDDIVERSHQVSMMGNIYSKSDLCIGWLGDFTAKGFTECEAQAAIDVLYRLGGQTVSPTSIPLSTVCAALEAFSMSSWFTRLWTVQEIVLPDKAILLWGSVHIPWEALHDAVSSMCDSKIKTYPYDLGIFCTGQIVAIGLLRTYCREAVPEEKRLPPPHQILWRVSPRLCLDPRDRIYAVASLFPRELKLNIDYSLTTAEVYKNVTFAILKATRSFQCLTGYRGQIGRTIGLPSWSVDFDPPSDIRDFKAQNWEVAGRYRVHNACSNLQMKISLSADQRSLEVTGIFIDRIKLVSPAIPAPIRPDPNLCLSLPQLTAILSPWHDLAAAHFGSDIAWRKAFRMTTSGNVAIRPSRDPSNEKWNYDTFLQAEFSDYSEYQICDRWLDISNNLVNQSFFITERGHMGTGPPNITVGDEVWVLGGSRLPFAVRPVSRDEHGSKSVVETDTAKTSKLLGDVYVHGFMKGEAVDGHLDEATTITLI